VDETLITTLVVLAFPVSWVIGMRVISMAGWGRLAEHYAARDDFDGRRWRFESARFGWGVHYGSCLTFGANARGMYLSTWFVFRPGHPALFIPWGDVTMKKTTFWHFPYAELRFRRDPDISLHVRERLGQHLAEAAGLPWPPAPAA